jgi:alpha-D-ribose 1-methylphosphonate 5-triphosphate synthase subunit PhnG
VFFHVQKTLLAVTWQQLNLQEKIKWLVRCPSMQIRAQQNEIAATKSAAHLCAIFHATSQQTWWKTVWHLMALVLHQ